MTDTPSLTSSYTLRRLLSETRMQVPRLVRGKGDVIPGFVGSERLDGKTRLLVQLRMARLMGCPVCAGVFPPLARRAGLHDEAIRSALDGRPDALSPEQYAAVCWAGTLVESDGNAPEPPPEPATALSDSQRRHLQFFVRMELVVHAAGLMFLPHGWVQRARQG